MRKQYGDSWTSDHKWPIKVTCKNCNENLELSPADLDGAFVFMHSFDMQSQFPWHTPALTAVMECLDCGEPLKI